MRKRFFALLSAVVLVCSLAACTSPTYETNPPKTEPPASEPVNTVPTTPEHTDPTVPEETRSPAVTSGLIPECDRVSSSYFDDVVFVGDSVSLKLTNYEAAMDVLGKADFVTAGSLGSANALWDLIQSDSVHPIYQGEKRYIEDSVALSGKHKVYIMLGMNDIALYSTGGAVENMKTLIGKILEKSPDVTIYVQSMTPIVSTSTILKPTGHCPENIDKYNAALLSMCEENGWYYLDVASVMKVDGGYLNPAYCSDPNGLGVHFNNAGCAAWVEYLYTHAID